MLAGAIESIRNRLYLLEKSLSITRAELELAILDDPQLKQSARSEFPVGSGLGQLLNSNERIEHAAIIRGEHFSKGVYCAWDKNDESTSCAIETVGFDPVGVDGNFHPSSCLIVTPRFNPLRPAEWFTLYTTLDLAALRLASALKLQLVLTFRYEPNKNTENFGVWLRLNFDNEHKDYQRQTFPVMDVPLSFLFEIPRDVYSKLALADAKSAEILIGLPTSAAASPSLIISAFNLTGSRR